MGLNNVTPQYLASLSTTKIEQEETDLTKKFFEFFDSNFEKDVNKFYLANYSFHKSKEVLEPIVEEIINEANDEGLAVNVFSPESPIEVNLSSNQIEELSVKDRKSYNFF